MSDSIHDNDPMSFVRNLWGNVGFKLPGMVAPTLDTDDLGKQIEDLKAVEGWLRMNLSMLQMTIQNLEMQRTTLSAVQAMGRATQEANESGATANAAASLSQAALWPWTMMQQVQNEVLNQQAPQAAPATASAAKARKPESAKGKKAVGGKTAAAKAAKPNKKP